MSLTAETLTEKAQQTIANSEYIARTACNIQLHPIHLASALLSDTEGLFRQLVKKCSVDLKLLEGAVQRALTRLPRQEPAPEHLSPSRSFISLLSKAQTLQKEGNDSHLAIDHLIIALMDERE